MTSQESTIFRKRHRQLANIFSFPLILITLTGLLSPILEALNFESAAEVVRQVHSGRIFLGSAYWIYTGLNALGLLWLLFTGLNMLRLFSKNVNMMRQALAQMSVGERRK